MKPWFIQEDNVIPFRKKDKGVVRLPNVNAYPDFLTGVQDLQNHLKQGDISSDIHKKLYQDLIHRFMKVESFETPWFLREAPAIDVDAETKKKLEQWFKKYAPYHTLEGRSMLEFLITLIAFFDLDEERMDPLEDSCVYAPEFLNLLQRTNPDKDKTVLKKLWFERKNKSWNAADAWKALKKRPTAGFLRQAMQGQYKEIDFNPPAKFLGNRQDAPITNACVDGLMNILRINDLHYTKIGILSGMMELPHIQSILKTGTVSMSKAKQPVLNSKTYDITNTNVVQTESFETPWFLREDQTSKIDQNIDKLVQTAKQNPQKSNFIKQGLEKLSNFLSDIIGQNNLKQENLVDVQQQANYIKQQFDLAVTKGIMQKTQKGQKFLQDLLQAAFQAGAEKEFTAQKNINTEILRIAGQLADKIAGSLDNIPAEEDKAGKPLSKKTMASKEKMKQQLIGLIQTIFKIDTTDMKSIQERDSKVEKIKTFMTACVRGIIDFAKLVKSKEGNIDNLVPPQYKDVYDQIKNSLMTANPGQTGANWGPGELGLAILGQPVSKAGKGDLKIGDEIIELKASSNPTKGGRFGSTALRNGGTQSKIFEKALNDLNQTMKKKFNLTPGTENYVYGPNAKFSWKQFSRNFISGLNRFIKINNTSQKNVIEFLQTVAMSCIDENQINFKLDFTDINNSVNPDNTIDPVKFQTAYSKMLYEIYKAVDQKEKLLIINPVSGNYKVIDDAEDLDNVVYGSTIIDFSDTQAKASPQVGLK